MPRPLRILPAGCVAHALNRGVEKRTLFDCVQDYEDFLTLVLWAKAKCTIRILAYCLMRNHWHFVVWPRTDDDVETFFFELTSEHAKRRRYQTQTVGYGHVYQDRYKAFVINTERHYLTVMRYVESNPLRANLVTSCKDWRWSSVQERLGLERGILDEGPVELPHDWVHRLDEPLADAVCREVRRQARRH